MTEHLEPGPFPQWTREELRSFAANEPRCVSCGVLDRRRDHRGVCILCVTGERKGVPLGAKP